MLYIVLLRCDHPEYIHGCEGVVGYVRKLYTYLFRDPDDVRRQGLADTYL